MIKSRGHSVDTGHGIEPTVFIIWVSLCDQGCDCAANWLILANSDPNFVITEISVNQVTKCFPAWGVGVFTIQEQPCKRHNGGRFLRILANFASGQSYPCVMFNPSVLDAEPIVKPTWGSTVCSLPWFNAGQYQSNIWPVSIFHC